MRQRSFVATEVHQLGPRGGAENEGDRRSNDGTLAGQASRVR